MAADYYDILGVTKGASGDEIKKAYRKQALEWHPDKHKDNKEAAEKRFKEINEAYQVLSNSQKRQQYDQFGPDFARGSAGRGTGSPFSYTYTSQSGAGTPFDFGDPFEIFEQFFGRQGSPFRQASVKRYGIELTFMEAAKGVEKEVMIEGKKRTIKIPAGVDEGSRIQFGDFILSVDVKPDDTFERDGADVYVQAPVPFSLVAMGGEIEVPTIEGKVKLKVRAGTPSGSMIRLKERGIARLQGRGKGDQYVRIHVQVPQKLTREQKKLVGELQEEGL